jgi:DsbC/DsbD-like thiol-disulfide interchange protein
MRGCESRRRFSPALAFLAALLLCATDAQASGSPIPHGTLELIAENQWIAIGHPFYLGLHFQLERGWHIYWVNPGDSGEPPRVTWQLPPGLSLGVIEWPAPRRLGTSSIVDFGYEDAVTLIVPMHAETSLAARPSARLGAEIKVLVCREICIPGRTQLSLTLPIESRPPAPDVRTRELFAAARKDLPRPAPQNWKFKVDDAKDSFVLAANLGAQITQAIFFPLAEAQIDNSAPQTLQPRASGFRLTLRKSDRLLKPIERLKGVLLLSGNHAYLPPYLIDVPVSKRAAQKSNSTAESTRYNLQGRDHKNEALDPILDARCACNLRSSDPVRGCESRPGGARFHGNGQQRQNISPQRLSRQVRSA